LESSGVGCSPRADGDEMEIMRVEVYTIYKCRKFLSFTLGVS
jgi:hypothetical protein